MNIPNFTELFGKLKQTQKEAKKIKEKLKNITVSAQSGGGMVKVIARGDQSIEKISISEDTLKLESKETIEDLIVAASNMALEQVREKGEKQLQDMLKAELPTGINPASFKDFGGLF